MNTSGSKIKKSEKDKKKESFLLHLEMNIIYFQRLFEENNIYLIV